jgi:hypothetical protein
VGRLTPCTARSSKKGEVGVDCDDDLGVSRFAHHVAKLTRLPTTIAERTLAAEPRSLRAPRTVTDAVTPNDFSRWKRRGYFESVMEQALLPGRANVGHHEQERP